MNSIKKYCVMSAIGIICMLFAGRNMHAGGFAARGAAAQPLQRYVNDAVRAALHQFDRVRVRARVLRNTAANAVPTRLFQHAPMPADYLGWLRPGMVLGDQVARNIQQAYKTYQTRFNALLDTANERLRGMNTAQSRAQDAEQRAAALRQQVNGLESLVHELVAAQEEPVVQSSCGEECATMKQQLVELQQCLRNAGNYGNQMQQDCATLQRRCAEAQLRIGQQDEALARYEREAANYRRSLEEQQRLYQQAERRNQQIVQQQAEVEVSGRSEVKDLQAKCSALIRAKQNKQNKIKQLEAITLKQLQENQRLQDVIQTLQANQSMVQPAHDTPVVVQLQVELERKDNELEILRARVQELETAPSCAIPVPPAAAAVPLPSACNEVHSAAVPAPPANFVLPSTRPVSTSSSTRSVVMSRGRSVAASQAMPNAQAGRDDLLASIRQGKQLRRVGVPEGQREVRVPQEGSFAAALHQRFQNTGLNRDSSDDDSSDDEDWS